MSKLKILHLKTLQNTTLIYLQINKRCIQMVTISSNKKEAIPHKKEYFENLQEIKKRKKMMYIISNPSFSRILPLSSLSTSFKRSFKFSRKKEFLINSIKKNFFLMRSSSNDKCFLLLLMLPRQRRMRVSKTRRH